MFSDQFSLSALSRYAFAYAVIAFIFLLNVSSFYLPLTDQVRPYFILIVIYYWTIYRPELLPSYLVFVLGFIFDIILNYPVGLHALIFLGLQWGVKTQSTYFMGQNYVIVWLGFALSCFSVLGIEYLFFSAISGNLFDIVPLIKTFILSAFFFPLFTFIFPLIHYVLPSAEK